MPPKLKPTTRCSLHLIHFRCKTIEKNTFFFALEIDLFIMLLYNAGERATASEWNMSFELRVAGERATSLGRVVDRV
jgi:hypothetical protein